MCPQFDTDFPGNTSRGEPETRREGSVHTLTGQHTNRVRGQKSPKPLSASRSVPPRRQHEVHTRICMILKMSTKRGAQTGTQKDSRVSRRAMGSETKHRCAPRLRDRRITKHQLRGVHQDTHHNISERTQRSGFRHRRRKKSQARRKEQGARTIAPAMPAPYCWAISRAPWLTLKPSFL